MGAVADDHIHQHNCHIVAAFISASEAYIYMSFYCLEADIKALEMSDEHKATLSCTHPGFV